MRTTGKQCGLAATGDYQPSLRSPWLVANDSGNTCQNLEQWFCPGTQVSPGKLGQVDGRHQTDGNRHQHGNEGHQHGACEQRYNTEGATGTHLILTQCHLGAPLQTKQK
ncbi:hypothetical protein, partial [Thiolapillus sp.]